VDDAIALFTVDHVCVEPTAFAGGKRSHPRHCFSTEWVAVGEVLDCERDVATLLGKHDAAPRADVEEWKSVEGSVPDLLHDSSADGCETAAGMKAEAA